MEIYTIGTSHGATEVGRKCTASMLKLGGCDNKDLYIIDPGCDLEEYFTNNNLPIENINAIFITHPHGDHMVGLINLIKRFNHYNTSTKCTIFFPEQQLLDALKVFLKGIHCSQSNKNIEYKVITEGEFFDDGKIKVSAIRTEHMGKDVCSYAFKIKAQDKNILFTGDLAGDAHDFPKIAHQEHFDWIVSELTHFDFERDMHLFKNCKTDNLIFSHIYPTYIPLYKKYKDELPYTTFLASDGDRFKI